MSLLSIVIPIHNEQENISELYRKIREVLQRDFSAYDYEINFIDDGSLDNSFSLLAQLQKNDPKVRVIKLSRNFGQHIAIKAGLDMSSGDYVALLDADLQDNPDDLKLLYTKLMEGNDIVIGVRKKRADSWFKAAGSSFFYKVIGKLTNFNMVSNQAMLRIFNRKVLNVLRQIGEISQNNGAFLSWVGFKQATVPVEHYSRAHGRTNYNLWRSITFAIDTILGFSNKPLVQISIFGIIISAGSVIFTLYILLRKFFYATPIGWTSVVALVSFLGGIAVFSLGVIGLYIGRMYRQSLGRPLYIIDTKLIHDATASRSIKSDSVMPDTNVKAVWE